MTIETSSFADLSAGMQDTLVRLITAHLIGQRVDFHEGSGDALRRRGLATFSEGTTRVSPAGLVLYERDLFLQAEVAKFLRHTTFWAAHDIRNLTALTAQAQARLEGAQKALEALQ